MDDETLNYFALELDIANQSYGFFSSHVWLWELDYKESWALKNWCFWTMVLEKTLESPLTARRSNKPILKEALNIQWKDWCWNWNSNILTTWYKELTHWKRPWCWEGLGAGGKGDDRGWDGWMASPTLWTWVWVDAGSCWWTGRPGVHGVAKSQTQLSNWTELKMASKYL